MVNTLSSVVTHGSKSKHSYASVHPRLDELDNHYNSNSSRNVANTGVRWCSAKLDRLQRYCNIGNVWRNICIRYSLRYPHSWQRISTRNSNQSCRGNRADRRHPKYYNKRYYHIALCLLTIGSPVLANEPEVNNTSNPVAAATGNVTNQAVQFQNNGAQSRQYYGPNISCNGSTMTFSPFYMGNHTEPRSFNEDTGSLRQDSYTKGENWGLQLNFMMPLDRESLRQCKRIAKRQEEKMRLDYELTRAIKCAEIMQKGFTLHPKSKIYVMCHDVVPIAALKPPKKPKKRFGLF